MVTTLVLGRLEVISTVGSVLNNRHSTFNGDTVGLLMGFNGDTGRLPMGFNGYTGRLPVGFDGDTGRLPMGFDADTGRLPMGSMQTLVGFLWF